MLRGETGRKREDATMKLMKSLVIALCSAAALPMAVVAETYTYAISDSSGGMVSNIVETVQGDELRVTSLYVFTNAAETASITFSEAATVDVLVVGGGGAGKRDGGGGGGGEVVEQTGLVVSAGAYDIVVGAGCEVGGSAGGESSVFSITAAGGKCASGSTGGASGNGNAGGTGLTTTAGDNRAAGGGGGAGAKGGNGGNGVPGGSGGDGVASSITGAEVYYGGGGGGGNGTNGGTPGDGGVGGGGRGGVYTGTAVAGKSGTGGGGGGGGGRGGTAYGTPGAGGSGIVIVRYVATLPSGFNNRKDGDICSKVDGYYVHTYTNCETVGTFTMPIPGMVDVLVVGGGGAGKRDGGGGGGGAVVSERVLLLPGEYSVTVGAGGEINGSAGGESSVFSISAAGGRCATA